LKIQEHEAAADELVARAAQVCEAGAADDAEKKEIVDIDEVTQRADDRFAGAETTGMLDYFSHKGSHRAQRKCVLSN
jgi:hypothetical protein